mmetsp:Transcript_146467/g.453647  ORF Transcript_146467/g.453647 Transcript_146467/m.453647 type:complete len:281 (+) Transcript_146467:62-904(+)
MARKLVANLGSAVAVLLAVFWTITLTRPWTWLWAENGIVLFQVDLWSVAIREGTPRLGTALATEAFDAKLGEEAKPTLSSLVRRHRYWIEDGAQELCASGVDATWHWCSGWMMVKYGSMIMVSIGCPIVVLLAMGSAFTYHYAHYRATRAGRLWIRACFVAAPCLAVLGLFQYVLLTLCVGKGDYHFIKTKNATYGAGFYVACCLTLLTAAPLYVFSVLDELEKHGAEAPEAGYGAAQTSAGRSSPAARAGDPTTCAGVPGAAAPATHEAPPARGSSDAA